MLFLFSKILFLRKFFRLDFFSILNFLIKDRLKFFIRDLYVYNILRTQINTFRLKNNGLIKRNLNSIDSLFKKNDPNIIFINGIQTQQKYL